MTVINRLKSVKWQMENTLQRFRILFLEEKNHSNSKSFLERDMLILAHSLEKGMGIPNPRKGYGKEKASRLIQKILEYQRNYGEGGFPFFESLAILDKYIDLQHSQNENIKSIDEERSKLLLNNAQLEYHCEAGSKSFTFEQLASDSSCELLKILESRHSIRHFSDELITEEELVRVVNIANRAPSACNRQPIKLYYTSNQKKSRELERLIDGSHGFKGETPYYMIVTSNRAFFYNDEYLQWYTNGGIYLGFLTIAFHSCGIGSVILQWKYAQKNEKLVKELFSINKNEAIVALIGYGKYPKDGTKCIVAQRKPASETIKAIE